VADFNPGDWVSGTTWESSLGETYTINGSATVSSRPTLDVAGRGDVYQYNMDETPAELTASPVAKNTGNTGSDYDITWQNVDPDTDMTWMANNCRFYPCDDGEGTSLTDIGSDQGGTLVNSPSWVVG